LKKYIFRFLFASQKPLLPRFKKRVTLLNMTKIFCLKPVTFKIICVTTLSLLSIIFGINCVNSIAQKARFSSATAVNLVSDFTIGTSSYTSQGSGEIVGDQLYTTGHNFTLEQVDFLLNNGAKFLSIKGECSRVVVSTRLKYNEGLLKIPLSTLNSQSAKEKGLTYPTVLKSNLNVNFINWYSDTLNPNYIYVRGITKNQNGKKEQILTGAEMFNSNGTGLSGGAYKYNADLTTIDEENKSSYLLGIHVGAAKYQGQKINIMWVANGDETFSYARYLPNGTIIRVDSLLNTECNL
jgi:hypothetical protein